MARLWHALRKSALRRRSDQRARRTSDRGLGAHLESLEQRHLLSTNPVLAGITTNDGNILSENAVLNEAPRELTFRFDGNQEIDATTLGAIRVVRSNNDGDFDDDDNVVVSPGYVAVGHESNDVVFRFQETLPDDEYRIEINGETVDLANVQGQAFLEGELFRRHFSLDLGAQVLAVVPQPISEDPVTGVLTQSRNTIDVYFNDDDLSATSAANTAFYQLIYTGHGDSFNPAAPSTASNLDDGDPILPESVSYDPATDVATLTFDVDDLADLPSGIGTYRLRIGTSEAKPLTPAIDNVNADAGSSFATARGIVTDLDVRGTVIHSAIEAQPYQLELPGSNTEPGHRQVSTEIDKHVIADADSLDGISTFSYNFKSAYGRDAAGNLLSNSITERQKQRVREIFELYGYYLGAQFQESESSGFTIANGDLTAVDPRATNDPNSLLGLAGNIDGFGPTAVINGNANLDDEFGEAWFQEAMRQVGFLLGMGASLDLPEGTIMGGDPILTFGAAPEAIFPGSHDIVHGQHLLRPDSIDIDLYTFDLSEEGLFTAEVAAERLSESSHLDSFLRLYQEVDGKPVLISQNDDYFGEDSYISLQLPAGKYYVGVSAKGNETYDPVIENSGFGGTTQGGYQLRLNHRPSVDNSIRDTTGTAFDGDADGRAGGVYNFWFRVQDQSHTLYVDRDFPPDGNGLLTNPFWSIQDAMEAASEGDIVRVVGNRLGDGDLTNDVAYEIGFDQFGQPLPDGGADGTLRVKPGVTLMIDAGAILKLGHSAIVVGSTSASVDRSGAAMQVLGTPDQPVYFTSYNDATLGIDTNPLETAPSRGDWGGIVFARDFDKGSDRFDYEDHGIFLNSINGADMRYGGGLVNIDSRRVVIDPVTMLDSRPTISNSTITESADAAMSASPNSFEETNFHAPEFQTVPFLLDYSRIGPFIRGNQVSNNTTNGIKISDPTPNANEDQVQTVSARWDDTDIVHVINNNLELGGSPGGKIVVNGVTQSRINARLAIDPGTVVKAEGSWINVGMGATLLAEGTNTHPVVFTALTDVRFGAGGTFLTSDTPNAVPQPGEWAGIYIGHTAMGSIDNAVVAYAGGVAPLGSNFSALNAIEIHQADARISNSRFEFNASGFGGNGGVDRAGFGSNAPASIFIRGAQPTILQNTFVDNDSAVISADVNSLNHYLMTDPGRQTGEIQRVDNFIENHGPLVRENVFEGNSLNGMVVRGGTLTTLSIWDDADIVHVVFDGIYVPNFHSQGGLQLKSTSSQGLVVKFQGEDAGFTTTGSALAIPDHIGGRVQILGQPNYPVVLTSIFDDTVGAGFDTEGHFQMDTNGGRAMRTVPASSDGSFQININFGPNISLNQEATEAVTKAARLWELELQDPITVEIDVEFADLGVGQFGNNLMQTTPTTRLFNFDQVRTQLIADAGPHESIVAELPNYATFSQNVRLPVDLTNAYAVAGDMRLTTANAKAINLVDDETTDGSILIHDDLSAWDFDRKDGLKTYREDFTTYMMREIGIILGFDSSVDDVNGALDGFTAEHSINVTPLDLFRFEPGMGNDDFTNASRVLDPRVPNHVFYAGGDFDTSAWPIPGLERGDVPLSTGRLVEGDLNDIFGSGFWLDDYLYRNDKLTINPPLGIMDPVSRLRDQITQINDPQQSTVGLTINPTEIDRMAFDVIGYDVVGGMAGDWQGITLENLTYTRNVPVVIENEPNALPTTAQFLGTLAPDLKQGNENQQLAFEIDGAIRAPDDVDVYSFSAAGGTPVWIDIDRTTSSLDTKVELVTATGTVLYASDDSLAESALGSEIPEVSVLSSDLYSSNIYDAGFGVELPGPPGLANTYFVRVSSAHGETSGAYQMQIRLQERDEISGTVIALADIRFATNGIHVVGPPIRSPLAGDAVEDESFNDTFRVFDQWQYNEEGMITTTPFYYTQLPFQVESQDIGNLLTSELGAISVLGSINDSQDVDWYKFDLGFDKLLDLEGQVTNSFISEAVLDAGVVFDIDYADGLSRPNLSMSVFDTYGNLLYYSVSSDLEADQQGDAGSEDLSRGSFGEQDPFIGPVVLGARRRPITYDTDFTSFGEIPEMYITDPIPEDPPPFSTGFYDGGVYYVAISSVAYAPKSVAYGNVDFQPVLGEIARGNAVTRTVGTIDPNEPIFFGECSFPSDPFDPTFPSFFNVGDRDDTFFCPTSQGGAGTSLTGEYQLEIRHVVLPESGQFSPTTATLGDENRERNQGQLAIEGNRISDSLGFGILIEDAERDLPEYLGGLLNQQTSTFDFDNTLGQLFPTQREHTNFSKGDYSPHAAPTRGLTTINEERLIPGVSIVNNVISDNVEGALHVQGDANGIVLNTYNLATYVATQDPCDAGDIDGMEFTIWDHHGNNQVFEFTTDGTLRNADGIPIKFDLALDNDGLFVGGTWEQATGHYPTAAYYVAMELEHALRSSDLDIRVLRGDTDEIYVEGAVEVGHPDVLSDGFKSAFWGINGCNFPVITSFIAQQGPVPFVRVVNNTIVGRGGDFSERGIPDVGVLIEDNASPTLLNNIIANFGTALSADQSSTDVFEQKRTFIGGPSISPFAFGGLTFESDDNVGFGWGLEGLFTFSGDINSRATSHMTLRDVDESATEHIGARPTVIGATAFQGNRINATNLRVGDFSLLLSESDPLFVDIVGGNYLLADNSEAIDSSVNTLQERSGLASVLSAIGFQPSEIVAPFVDADGVLRIDHPQIESSGGVGQNAFIDRGALERADFEGPVAVLVAPEDNDLNGTDLNPQTGEVFLQGSRPTEFLIRMTGVDDSTVTSQVVQLLRDGELLQPDLDYRFTYDSTADAIRLSPLVGSWPDDFLYTIIIDNTVVADLSQNQLAANRSNRSTRFDIAVGKGFDYGDAPVAYPVTDDRGGARHRFVPDVYLGSAVDVDVDGQPSTNADADFFDDGVQFDTLFIPGSPARFTVNASTNGNLSVWIDLNADGDWDDGGELIVSNRRVTAGSNEIRVSRIPDSEALNDANQVGTAIRFRYSTGDVSLPTGEAIDGEVEDYFIALTNSPWQNPGDPLDVNVDGGIGPLDAVLVINELTNRVIINPTTGRLPIPPIFPNTPGNLGRYLDVNGDGFVSPVDALMVINALPSTSVAASAPLAAVLPVSSTDRDAATVPIAPTDDWSRQSRAVTPTLSSQAVIERHVEASNEPLLEPAANERPTRPRSGHRAQIRARRQLVGRSIDQWAASHVEDALSSIAEDVLEGWAQ